MEEEDSERDFGQVDGTCLTKPVNAWHHYYII